MRFASRNHIIVTCAGCLVIGLAGRAASQDASPGATGGGAPPFPWEGEVTASNVYVRSGAGSNWYPTTKLNNGDRVVVLGEKFGWYQIAPVPGSFSYVDLAAVDRAAGAKKGVIKQDKVYIRAGSQLEQRKNATQVVMNKGDTVEVIGEADGFYKITPPPGAMLYISKQYVRPVDPRLRSGMVERHLTNQPRSLPPEKPADIPPSPIEPGSVAVGASGGAAPGDRMATNVDKSAPAAPAAPGAQSAKDAGPVDAGMARIPESEPDADGADMPGDIDAASTGETDADGPVMEPEKPAAKATTAKPIAGTSAGASARLPDLPAGQPRKTPDRYKAMLAVLESELVALLALPLEQQNPEPLWKKYEEIASQTEEYVPAEVAKIRVRQLKDRATLKLARRELIGDAEAIAAYRANMDQERMKILRRKVAKAMERFELEGELWRSHAFSPESRRFRLVDPSSKSTVAYVDIPVGVDPNPDHLIGRLVGINSRTQKFSPSARVPIAEAREVVDLSIRRMPPPTDDDESAVDLGENIPAPADNSAAGELRDRPAAEPSAAGGRSDDDRLP